MEQVAVRGVDLDDLEAGGERAAGGGGEGADDAGDAGVVERAAGTG